MLFLVACLVLAVPLLFAGRFSRSFLTFVLVGVATAFGARAALTRSLLPRTAVDWPNMLALLLLPLGLWASADLATSWPVAYKVVAGFAVFYGLAGLARTRWLEALPWLLLALSMGLALVVLVATRWSDAKIALLPDALYDLLPTVRLPWRPEGIHPNLAGGAMALLLLPAVALAWWGPGRWLRLLAILTALATGLVLLLSQSRGAWIGAAGALALMPWMRYRRWWVVLVVLALLALLAGALLGPDRMQALFFPTDALDETTVNTLPGRLELWARATYLIRDFGLTGAGMGMFEPVVMALYPPFFTGIQGGFIHAHNVFLQMAVDFGVPGLVLHLAVLLGLGASLLSAVRTDRQESPDAAWSTYRALAVGLFGSLLVYVLHGMVEAPPVAPRGYVLAYALFGAAAAVSAQLLAPEQVVAS